MGPPTFGSKVATFFKRLIITLALLGLAGVTVFLLSQQNSRTFTLEVHDGKLVVFKGRMMPMGTEAWRPPPELADAYAPLDLKTTTPFEVLNKKFSDRDELDRALFSVIEGLAKPRVLSDDPADITEGINYLRRAEKLGGLSDEQKASLKQMKGDVAFYSARLKLEDAQKLLDDALTQLRLSTGTQNKHSRSAYQMLTTVEPQAKALVEALRKAVNGLSAPSGQKPVEDGAQAPAPEAPAQPPGTPAPAANGAAPPAAKP